MAEFEIFPNAPITEAVLDIFVRMPENANLDILEKYHDKIKDRFPDKQERRFFKGKVSLFHDKPGFGDASGGIDGYLFKSTKENKVVQSRKDGFTFNKLKPYEKWALFKPEAKEFWDLYLNLVKPERINKLGLRYINRIELPLPFDDFKEYILTRPEIAPNLPQNINHFLLRIVISKPEIKAVSIVILTIEEPTKENKLPLIIDISVVHESNYSVENPNIWDIFENLREFKNEVFFNSITDKTKEFFR
jgi:uncharacterized protein (TIGR04255 family)